MIGFREMTEKENEYTYTMEDDVRTECGFIGYLRADMDTDGNGFFSNWTDYNKSLKVDRFKSEFDDVINSMRDNGGILHNGKDLANYCYTHPQAEMKGQFDYYGVRVDTEEYVYLFRLNPNRGAYNIYCYCYVKSMLDKYMKGNKVV